MAMDKSMVLVRVLAIDAFLTLIILLKVYDRCTQLLEFTETLFVMLLAVVAEQFEFEGVLLLYLAALIFSDRIVAIIDPSPLMVLVILWKLFEIDPQQSGGWNSTEQWLNVIQKTCQALLALGAWAKPVHPRPFSTKSHDETPDEKHSPSVVQGVVGDRNFSDGPTSPRTLEWSTHDKWVAYRRDGENFLTMYRNHRLDQSSQAVFDSPGEALKALSQSVGPNNATSGKNMPGPAFEWHVPGKLNGKSVEALADTGVNCNAISASYASERHLTPDSGSTRARIRLLLGNYCVSLGMTTL